MADPAGSAPVWISPDRPHVPPPAVFLAAAVLGFPFVAAFVAAATPALARLEYRTWTVLAANHLVTLGWGTMVAMGALYQLLPAAAGVRRDPGRADTIVAVVYIGAVIALAAGFWIRSVPVIITGGLAAVGAVVALLRMALHVALRRRRWSWPLTYVGSALICLLGVTAWGALMASNWRWHFWPALFGPLGLGVHLPLGLIGWFGLLVTGVSYYLLPRFADRRIQPATFIATIYVLLVAGLVALVAGAAGWPQATRMGLALVGGSGLLYARDIWQYVSGWRGRAPDITRVHWIVMIVETVVLSAGLIASAIGVLPGDPGRWIAGAVALFLLGWLTVAITGQVYKVTPFLMWYYRFFRRIPAFDVPRLPAPYWPSPAPWALAGIAAGGLLISGSIVAGSVPLAQIGGPVFLVGSLIFSVTIGYSWLPALRRRRPKAAPRSGPRPL